MQITAELDSQHLEKLHLLERTLKKNTSELISFAIDEIFTKNPSKTEDQNAYCNQALLAAWKMAKIFQKIIKIIWIGAIKYDYCRYRILDCLGG